MKGKSYPLACSFGRVQKKKKHFMEESNVAFTVIETESYGILPRSARGKLMETETQWVMGNQQ